MLRMNVVIFLGLVVAYYCGISSAKPPNILLIVADDLGWNDVGFHNPDMLTPNIDKLAKEGIILNHSYVQPVCSPSRTAFMTGIYPFKAGLQHYVIEPRQPVCSPLNFTFLPQELKKLGYATHAIGKWHLGFCNWNCTPTYRGFDSFFGYYNGAEDYYTHRNGEFLDFRDDKTPARNYTGEYSAYTFAKRAVDIISSSGKDQQFFIYLPFQSVHAPIEVPKQYEDMYPNVVNIGRRKFCGMVSALDEAIGNITDALKQAEVYEDTLIVLTADNGGELVAYGNNWPLRGGKHTVWEGGTRGSAFIHGAGLKRTGYKYDGLIHAVDWMPTLISAAGGKPVAGIDGVDQWEAISTGTVSKRNEFVYNLDDFFVPTEGHAAIRMGDFKLIMGYPGRYNGWYKPMDKKENTQLEGNIYDPSNKRLWLFNITNDPTEKHDLSQERPDVVKNLTARLDEHRKQMVPANFPPNDPNSNPKLYENVWSPGWC